MKRSNKLLAAAIASVIASAAMISTVGADAYYVPGRLEPYGNTLPGIIDGDAIIYEDLTGVYKVSLPQICIAEDVIYGNVYYDKDIGYYSICTDGYFIYLGHDFKLSEYVGSNGLDTKFYYNAHCGYVSIYCGMFWYYGYNKDSLPLAE